MFPSACLLPSKMHSFLDSSLALWNYIFLFLSLCHISLSAWYGSPSIHLSADLSPACKLNRVHSASWFRSIVLNDSMMYTGASALKCIYFCTFSNYVFGITLTILISTSHFFIPISQQLFNRIYQLWNRIYSSFFHSAQPGFISG